MTIDFNGQAVVITGGASGIGLALAQQFGREGARVLIADLAQDSLVVEAVWAGDIGTPGVIQEGADDMFFIVERKYRIRSMMSTHIRKMTNAMILSTGPPRFMKSRMDSSASTTQNMATLRA